ncbi:MAG: hypothetical protein HPY62_09290 [Bacteroidales bacterium]|nr:hypothetical protein [Bacteroidales bacterium]
MKTRKLQNSRNTKFIRIDNNKWIETKVWVPDEVAKSQFYKKMQLIKPGIFPSGSGQNIVTEG